LKSSLFIAVFFLGIACQAQEKTMVMPALVILKDFDKVRDFTMDQNGNEAYFTIQSQTEDISVISMSLRNGNEWGTPKIASFSGAYKDMEPFLSPNGLRLYFVSNRPLNKSTTDTKDFDIWYVERESPSKNWSSPINMGTPINTEHNEFYPAVSTNGNLYYTGDRPDSKGEDDIFFSSYENGKYSEPISLGENINSKGYEYNAYIGKDESYLIFGGYAREDGQGSGDLYISFKGNDNEWSKAKPLPVPINSRYMDYCPFVDEPNGLLYFTSRRVQNPTGTIENMDHLKQFLDSYENGNSRLYKVKMNIKDLRP
jgi:hypothetical protein